jgi:hypothetical protein
MSAVFEYSFLVTATTELNNLCHIRTVKPTPEFQQMLVKTKPDLAS